MYSPGLAARRILLQVRYNDPGTLAKINGRIEQHQLVHPQPEIELVAGGAAREAAKGVPGQIHRKRPALWRR
jgi:hypothetical protein